MYPYILRQQKEGRVAVGDKDIVLNVGGKLLTNVQNVKRLASSRLSVIVLLKDYVFLIMYKVNTTQTSTLSATGLAISFTKPLPLVTGWNWAAYLPNRNSRRHSRRKCRRWPIVLAPK